MNHHAAVERLIDPPDERWTLGEVVFSCDEQAPSARSAAAIFNLLLRTDPAVVLKSRMPTISLPCRSYARGNLSTATVEVLVDGDVYGMQVRLRPLAQSLLWKDVVPVARHLDLAYADGLALRRIDVHLEAGDAPIPAAFHAATPGPAPLSQWFGDTRRVDLTSPMRGDVSLERSFVISNGGDQPRIRAQSTAHQGSGPTATLSWTELLAQAIRAVET